ncbi:MAG: hypothetical protein EHM23_20355 [Acidobacteria bacterium]|nr:MAG: hypothetical protein EHM23_20355 [Acidobacteriota bacterium]
MRRLLFLMPALWIAVVPCLGDKSFYFPHFGDGGGVCTVVVVTNTGDQDALVTLSVYSRSGGLQTVAFTTGSIDETTFILRSRSSRSFTSAGTSSPVKSGYIEITSNTETLTATALFRFANGTEAGILPVAPAKRFGLFVERTSSIDTGIAVQRTTLDPVDLTLYTSLGAEFKRITMILEGYQQANFLGELFSGLSDNFTGFLVLESRQPITVVGLRSGDGRLSTVAVEQNKTIGQLIAEKFLGMWYISYEIDSSIVDQFAICSAYEDSVEPGKFFAGGMNKHGQPALATYSPTLKKLVLVCQGTTVSHVYDFAFLDQETVTGCYRTQFSDGTLSKCYPLVGLRHLSKPSTQFPTAGGNPNSEVAGATPADCPACSQDQALVEEINVLKAKVR